MQKAEIIKDKTNRCAYLRQKTKRVYGNNKKDIIRLKDKWQTGKLLACINKTKLISSRKMVLMNQLIKDNLIGEKWEKIKIIISLKTKDKQLINICKNIQVT